MPVHEDCLLRIFYYFLRPFVRGTPTTHSEGLLLRVGALPCAPTYNRGVVQHVVFNRLGLTQPHECSSKAAIYHANSFATSSNNLYRGRNCCTTHASKPTYRYFLGTRLRLPRRVTLERVPTDLYFYSLLAASICCHRDRHGTRLRLPRRVTLERVPTDLYFYSLLAASICCHRDRHRCDTVIR